MKTVSIIKSIEKKLNSSNKNLYILNVFTISSILQKNLKEKIYKILNNFALSCM